MMKVTTTVLNQEIRRNERRLTMSTGTYQVYILRAVVIVLLHVAGLNMKAKAMYLAEKIKRSYSTIDWDWKEKQ
jgi:hypothetical protein